MKLSRLLGFGTRGHAVDMQDGWRGMDYHSHLLPGVDDGMASLDDAKLAIIALKDLGFSGAVLTPHIYKDVFDNSSVRLRSAFAAFTDALTRDGVNFSTYLGAEYFADEHFLRLIEADDLLSLQVAGERWVLLEFPYLQETPYAGVCLAALCARGYRPVVAHVERYRFVAQQPDVWLEKFRQAGAVLQGDIGSLVGQYGEPVQKFANWLRGQRKISIWGTDLHHPGQVERHMVPGLARLGSAGRLNAMLDSLTMPVAA